MHSTEQSSPAPSDFPTDLLKNRIVLVTGAYGGLGHVLCKELGRLGATVILLGRSIPHLEKLYDELEEAGAEQPGIIPLDLEGASKKEYEDLAETIEKEFGQLNGLVHCAAALGSPTPLQVYDMAEWAKVMAANLHGPIMLTQSLMPLMDKSNRASIVFTLDDHDTAYWGAYGISKAALRATASIMADETENLVNKEGIPRIVVNQINPGPMRTRLRAKSFPGELPVEVPLPDTRVGYFIDLLARSDAMRTGQDIRLDR